jgi:histone-lysine N-methyltransferase SETMAR
LRWTRVILEHYMPRGNTVTSVMYADLLKNHLRPSIKSKQRRLLSTGVFLQHDNPRSHTARWTVATIQDLSFECLPHQQYSPDLAQSDFHVFGLLKVAMGGKSFRSDKEVQLAVHEWLRSEPKDFFSRGIHALPKCWNTRMEHSGDYIEKLCHCVPFVFSKLQDKKIFKVFIWLTLILISMHMHNHTCTVSWKSHRIPKVYSQCHFMNCKWEKGNKEKNFNFTYKK